MEYEKKSILNGLLDTNMTKMNNLSYEKYLESSLHFISNNFTVKTYKLANKEIWSIFDRKVDCRVQIRWCDEEIHEFILEKSFWYQSNRNNEDRLWMRAYADQHIKMCKDAYDKGKEKYLAEKKNAEPPVITGPFITNIAKAPRTFAAGHTQKSFEKNIANLRKK